ncbi:uncharacterized protein LOC115255490 [Aedes albopictus]|uniref:Uncharacterized protein n=1 Tax=Aedes albopictus TaxID=7160 RepID=A0ABM1Z7A6_AEDAL
MIEYRKSIIPPFLTPNWEKGYLSCTVSVRDLIENDARRITELADTRSKLDAISNSYDAPIVIDCLMRVAGGPDSATGFSQYNQENILGSDESLLSENYMCLELITMSGDEIYRNPNPQSDLFCRPRSLSWTKETDAITLEMYNNFFDEINDIKDDPVIVNVDNIRLRITVEAIYSLIDGKAANAIVGNKNTHACPVCIAGVDSVIGPSYFHSRLNSAEWLIRNAAKKNIPNNPALTNPEVRAEHRKISNNLEDQFKAHVNRPKPGGSGSSNNGNLARLMLSDPTAFSNILGINVKLVENLRLISNLALSSRRLDPEKVQQLYEELEKNIIAEFTFVKKLPPCLHKYKHFFPNCLFILAQLFNIKLYGADNWSNI